MQLSNSLLGEEMHIQKWKIPHLASVVCIVWNMSYMRPNTCMDNQVHAGEYWLCIAHA